MRMVDGTAGLSSQRIATTLRAQILAGDIEPGTWLRQDDIASRLGTSRLPVRDALRILEQEGLAESLPHRGSRVPALDVDDIRVLYLMRERVEPLTLAESMPHLTHTQVARMESVQRQIEQNTDVGEFLNLDRDFHMTSYSMCPSEELLKFTNRMWNSTQHYRRAFMTLRGAQRLAIVIAEHQLLLDAIKRHDQVDAERFLSGHIRRTRVELTQTLEERRAPVPTDA